jgi:Protein phosphatase 2C
MAAAAPGSAHGNGWQVRGVSVQGYRHLVDGTECQDAHRSLFVPEVNAWILAVSDGAGSRPRAAEGSALAAGVGVTAFASLLGTRGLPTTSDGWRATLASGYTTVLALFTRAVAQLSPDERDFAATLSVAILAPPWVGLVSLGDGFVILQAGAEPRLHLIALDERESEYSNETVFLTSSDAVDRGVITCVYDPQITGLVMSTDGLAPVAIRLDDQGDERPNETFIHPLIERVGRSGFDPTEIVRFLLHDRIGGTSGDDKTMLIAVAP